MPIIVRPDDPPSPRLSALLLAALVAVALLIGGSSAAISPTTLAWHADSSPEESLPGDVKADERVAPVERRAPRRRRRLRASAVRFPDLAPSPFVPLQALRRSTPLRGPPRVAIT